MERPAFWKVPRDLQEHQLSEGTAEAVTYSKPPPDAPTGSLLQEKPALAALASYSLGFANLGLQSSPLTAQTPEPEQPSSLSLEDVNQPVDKPAVSALACHAFGFADLGLKVN